MWNSVGQAKKILEMHDRRSNGNGLTIQNVLEKEGYQTPRTRAKQRRESKFAGDANKKGTQEAGLSLSKAHNFSKGLGVSQFLQQGPK
jgi:hypothetical protein